MPFSGYPYQKRAIILEPAVRTCQNGEILLDRVVTIFKFRAKNALLRRNLPHCTFAVKLINDGDADGGRTGEKFVV